MAKNNTITFFDLALSTGATISPFVWATKYALKHKGFDLDVVPGGFTRIPERTGGKTERLPAIIDDGKWVLDSLGHRRIPRRDLSRPPDADSAPERCSRDARARCLVLERGDRPVDAQQLRQLPRPRQPRGPRIHHPLAREDARQDARGNAGRLRRPPAADFRRARTAAHCAAREQVSRRRHAQLRRLPHSRLDPVHRLGVPEQPGAGR